MGRPRKDASNNAAILDNAEQHVKELIADSPNGIQILSNDDTPNPMKNSRVGGEDPSGLGREWWVKVTELDLPYAKDVQVVAFCSRAGRYKKEFRANTEVVLPEAAIKQLEEGCTIYSERPINVGPDGMTKEAAERMNPGMKVIQRGMQLFLVEERPRFHVQRIKPVQESYIIPAL